MKTIARFTCEHCGAYSDNDPAPIIHHEQTHARPDQLKIVGVAQTVVDPYERTDSINKLSRPAVMPEYLVVEGPQGFMRYGRGSTLQDTPNKAMSGAPAPVLVCIPGYTGQSTKDKEA